MLWAEDPTQSARSVYRRYGERHGQTQVGLRKVQEIIALAKARAPERSFPFIEWRPWNDEAEASEDAAYLLQLNAASQAIYGRNLYQHEAAWGRRLRVALEGLSLIGQLVFVKEYANRERLSFFFSEPPGTADLDALVAYRPWVPENYEPYHVAVYFGLIPALFAWALREFFIDPEAYWRMVEETQVDPQLPTLNRLGCSSSFGFLTGFDFQHPRLPAGAEGEPDIKQRLQAWVAGAWAGRYPRSDHDKHQNSEEGSNER